MDNLSDSLGKLHALSNLSKYTFFWKQTKSLHPPIRR